MTNDPPPEPQPRRYRRRESVRPEPEPERLDAAAALVERFVDEALSRLPKRYADRLENVEIVVEREPDAEERRRARLRPGATLYGLYQGIPLPLRGTGYGSANYHMAPPDKISIFWDPLVRDFPTERRLARQVEITVLHEIAHFFGISDEDLRHTSVH